MGWAGGTGGVGWAGGGGGVAGGGGGIGCVGGGGGIGCVVCCGDAVATAATPNSVIAIAPASERRIERCVPMEPPCAPNGGMRHVSRPRVPSSVREACVKRTLAIRPHSNNRGRRPVFIDRKSTRLNS